jgi:hypothetical protein
MFRWFAIVAVCFLSSAPAWAEIGKISTQVGPDSSIQRGKQVIAGKPNTGIVSNDTVSTRKGTTLNINFRDNTKVKITENSRLVIDDFVYDPKRSDAGRLAMKVSMGTVRYASGQIAKVNPQRINIKTPSAAIAVRGTDFHMTVDEAGRSLVVLVPSCRDENETVKTDDQRLINCQTGKIVVENAAGSVELTEPFSATYVANFDASPSAVVILKLTTVDPRISFDSQVTNDLIISPPEAVQEQIAKSSKENDFEEKEEETVTRVANADANRNNNKDDAKLTALAAGSNARGPCSEKIICVEANPYVTFYRTTESDHYAEVRARLSSNLSLTIVHNGDEGKLGWGAAPNSGNTVTIRQSK